MVGFHHPIPGKRWQPQDFLGEKSDVRPEFQIGTIIQIGMLEEEFEIASLGFGQKGFRHAPVLSSIWL